eukprot:CAMPEP_0203665698 /NCGR_PEP_ID=MMETSP0090-20130426/2870_1 /ASSEMBLY_ACC=CAM_ASM_001088 /TAXON_ID=426623 /ORGANISM="Chaetoceros affinis, Strain CCMP159" /LENGTH=707 /DNA_ID=CAMNT_0050529345 /DNA_START=314 /DNA_END=2437 /DNA_ORIENTATION=+
MSSPTKETTITPETSETPTEIKEKLKQQLASQLLYYFSSKNLVQNNDVYLSTIMKLNSGHVPVSILSNFANVNKIIARSGILFQDGTHQDEGSKEDDKDDSTSTSTSTSNHGTHDHNSTSLDNDSKKSGVVNDDGDKDGSDTSKGNENEFNDYTKQIHRLLREAALECNLLSLVTLDQNGNVVNTGTSTKATASTDTTGTAVDVETNRIIRRFDAIGPSSEFNGVVPDDNVLDMYQDDQRQHDYKRRNNNSNAENQTDSENDTGRDERSVADVNPIATSNPNATSSSNENKNDASNTSKDDSISNTSKGKGNIIIILRDVHEDATEEEVRQVFDESDQILDVVQEIGNCWFVTLDMNQQDVVTTMLNLRQKTICSEPIKARLKTQSISSSVAASNSAPVSDGGNNGNSYSSSDSDKVNGGYRSNYYSGRNPYHRNGVRNKTPSTGGRYNNYSASNATIHKNSNIYSGDRASFMNGKNNSNNYNGKKSSRGHYFNDGGSTSYYGSQNYQPQRRDGGSSGSNSSSTGGGDNLVDKAKKVQKNLPPPPPVVEEHYPTLTGDGNSVGPSSPTSIANLELRLRNRVSTATSGYAAALLKAAPPSLPATTPATTTITATNVKPLQNATATKTVTSLPSPKGAKKKNETSASFLSAKATVSTVNTDDSSSDDKSSLSSKPESDSFTRSAGVTSPTMSSTAVWGGGRSFADVLKE